MATLVIGTNKGTAVPTLLKDGAVPVVQSLNVTPTTSAQTITAPSGVTGYTPVNVSAVDSTIDQNILSQNIKNGVTILGITGSYTGTTPSGTLNISANGNYDVTNYATASVSVSGGSSDLYPLLSRVWDDSNNEIGTVFGYTDTAHTHALVALDASQRFEEVLMGATGNYIPSIEVGPAIYGAPGIASATAHTTDLIDWATNNSTTSPAPTACRAKTYTINNVVYAADLPTIANIVQMLNYCTEIDSLDPTIVTYPDNALSYIGSSSSTYFGSSTFYSAGTTKGQMYGVQRTRAALVASSRVATSIFFICPILVIPNS